MALDDLPALNFTSRALLAVIANVRRSVALAVALAFPPDAAWPLSALWADE